MCELSHEPRIAGPQFDEGLLEMILPGGEELARVSAICGPHSLMTGELRAVVSLHYAGNITEAIGEYVTWLVRAYAEADPTQ